MRCMRATGTPLGGSGRLTAMRPSIPQVGTTEGPLARRRTLRGDHAELEVLAKWAIVRCGYAESVIRPSRSNRRESRCERQARHPLVTPSGFTAGSFYGKFWANWKTHRFVLLEILEALKEPSAGDMDSARQGGKRDETRLR